MLPQKTIGFAIGIGLLICCSATANNAQPNLLGLASYEMPKFPPELVGVKAGDGEVVMVVTIDAEGAVKDLVVLEATNEAFARSAFKAVSDWRFGAKSSSSSASATSTTSADASVQSTSQNTYPRREVLQFSFKRSGVVTTLSHAEAARESFVTSNIPQVRTVRWNQLDSEPQRLTATMPKVSKANLAAQGARPLSVNFVIDREGQVRVPVVAASVDPELAKSVLAAVASWRYTSPLYQQQPVAVEVTKALILPQK